MTNKLAMPILLAAFGLVLAACGAAADDVPSLGATPTAVAAEEALDNEARMMAFTQCLREQGIEVRDPGVDSEGNVEKPEFIEGTDKEALGAVWEACAHHLEGFTISKERTDVSEQVDQWLPSQPVYATRAMM